ncbi:hypothetical protein HYPSUDRAFT_894716 [Hypholoma sublateritium FD-334 SS-4]|uniref:Uncharacterized protein n=1 Tax=Hypholoma sublateritium (strain FD-334 SS-4) TaxID=945553 RepID=A0A0D2NK57_HYPSF|nr:hypothetical protein HYPSUDRAFT_894716 [Hypholoma sublateritium FD-334 SS-4]
MGIRDFVRHVYYYFLSDSHVSAGGSHLANPHFDSSLFIPVYDSSGHLVRFIEGPKTEKDETKGQGSNTSTLLKVPTGSHNLCGEPILCMLTADGRYIPVPPSKENVPLSKEKELPPLPIKSIPKPKLHVTPTGELWDGWPDGPIERDFTHTEFKQTGKLRTHWSVRANGGYPNNKDSDALEWQDGLKTRRICLGVIECDNPTCQIITRPKVKLELLQEQLQEDCKCGGTLYRQECDVISFLFQWSGVICNF